MRWMGELRRQLHYVQGGNDCYFRLKQSPAIANIARTMGEASRCTCISDTLSLEQAADELEQPAVC